MSDFTNLAQLWSNNALEVAERALQFAELVETTLDPEVENETVSLEGVRAKNKALSHGVHALNAINLFTLKSIIWEASGGRENASDNIFVIPNRERLSLSLLNMSEYVLDTALACATSYTHDTGGEEILLQTFIPVGNKIAGLPSIPDIWDQHRVLRVSTVLNVKEQQTWTDLALGQGGIVSPFTLPETGRYHWECVTRTPSHNGLKQFSVKDNHKFACLHVVRTLLQIRKAATARARIQQGE